VFPSYFNRERRDQIDHPRIFGTFRFSGALEELYATLVKQFVVLRQLIGVQRQRLRRKNGRDEFLEVDTRQLVTITPLQLR